ncbi:MAG TPA: M23 family metallopeptidase [Planktothrix sp.]
MTLKDNRSGVPSYIAIALAFVALTLLCMLALHTQSSAQQTMPNSTESRTGSSKAGSAATKAQSASAAASTDSHQTRSPNATSSRADATSTHAQSVAPLALPSSSVAAEPGLIVDENGKPIPAETVLRIGDELFFLTPHAIWRSAQGTQQLTSGEPITAARYATPTSIGAIPVQELFAMVYLPSHYSIVVLDKSGDLYEFDLKTNTWRLFRANLPFLAKQPDPDFIDLASLGTSVALLDPERNQIWKVPGSARVLDGFFPDTMPWHVGAQDAKLGDAAAIAFDGTVYVLTRHGLLTIYGDGHGKTAPQSVFTFLHPHNMRPSRLITAAGMPLYIVERENNRVLAVDKKTHKVSQFVFPQRSDLHGLLPAADGFWIVNRGRLQRRELAKPDGAKVACHPRHIDTRLNGMVIPIVGMRLPRHPGVFPGARRLYRYGVHEGLDLFYDSGARTKVQIGTPAIAALRGRVERADADYHYMTVSEFNRILAQCSRQHRTSAKNEDLFRGCQVWIDHGNRLMTRYAHLSKINLAIKKGDQISGGDVIGYVGVSGTGQDLPGRTRFPHLHFEIWLDGHYLGYGLSPEETMSVYEDIFGLK